MLTEHRAGTCVYNDAMVVSTGTATWDALRDARARHRGEPARPPTARVLDAGSKVLTSDLYHMKGFGHVMEYPEAAVAHLSEEHAVVDSRRLRGAAEGGRRGQRGAEPLLRGHQHGGRDLRGAGRHGSRWCGRWPRAAGCAEAGVTAHRRAPGRGGAGARPASGISSRCRATRSSRVYDATHRQRPLDPPHAARGGGRAHGGRVGTPHRGARRGAGHRRPRPPATRSRRSTAR